MTDAINLPGSVPSGDRIPALQGVLVAESPCDISVRVEEGTWTFRRSDVLRILDSATLAGPATAGDSVLVDIRPGAFADFTQRRRIDLVNRPMTLAAEPSAALGDELLQQLTASWADRLQLVDVAGGNGATFTYCQTKSHNGSDDGISCDSLD
ncbi:hypothetical protein [Nocardia goodfellowii]|uniref:Uncharacterized protein n=1 Tax=Nocardia goodfellowii TaxID=882446 RepID=A0ABS4QGN9_9NOCA|nr:hypothetical protein [Nocardia goodfellowii]MBP2190842.1 hypothetical protein [Nocardia goodfellowii]